jgi:chemotaxis protein MotB
MASKKHHEEEEHGGAGMERWLLTYADMITLLMVFFIILYSISLADAAKFKQLSTALTVVFGGSAKKPLPGSTGLLQNLRRTQSEERLKQAYVETVSQLQKEIQDKKIRVNMTPRGMQLSISSDFYFVSGSAELTEEAKILIQKVMNTLKDIPNPIQVEGHTDNNPIVAGSDLSKRYPTNWELSSQRGINVLQFMNGQGIREDRLSAAAYADTKPIKPNDTPEGRAINRRVEILVLYE